MKKEKDLMELVGLCGVAKPADTKRVPAAQETAKLLEELGFKQAALNVNQRLHPLIKKAEIASEGYVEITPEKINEYLKRKADEYDKKRSSDWKVKETYNALRDYLTNNAGSYGSGLGQSLNQQWQSVSNTVTSTSTNVDYQQLANASPGYLYFSSTTTLPSQTAYGYGSSITLGSSSYGVETFSARTMDYTRGGEGTIGQFVWNEVPVESYAGIPPLNVLKKFQETKDKKIFDSYSVASVNAVRDPLLLGRIANSTSRYFIAQWGDDVSLDDVI